MKKKGKGRPRIPATKQRRQFLTLRFTDAEMRELERAAQGPVRAWVRQVILREAHPQGIGKSTTKGESNGTV